MLINQPVKHQDGRYLYTDKQLLGILKHLPDKRKSKLLLKALNFMDQNVTTKIMAIAIAFDCRYDEISTLWSRDIRINRNLKS